MDAELLDESTAADYLIERGLVPAGPVRVWALSGGVSNVVLAVDGGGRRLVLKQSLAKLRVPDEWHAPRARILHEAAALEIAAALTPDSAPAVVDVDPERFALTIARAPDDWQDWRTVLLDGDIDPDVGRSLGATLAGWHTATAGGALVPVDLAADTDTFRALRVSPFHETIRSRHPEVGDQIGAVIDRMLGTRECLVHGDFSPKNILVGGGAPPWIIDFEVAHLGDPVFDLAFLLAHLVIKSVHRPEDATRFDDAGIAFLAAYTAATPVGTEIDSDYLSAQVGCLLLARVDGKSPAGYLDGRSVETVRRLGMSLLTDPMDLRTIARRRTGMCR